VAERPRHILVVEDEFFIALDLQSIVSTLGHVCIGPAKTVAEALTAIESVHVDAAILNVLVDGWRIDPVCERLTAKGIPFAFATGLEKGGIDKRWRAAPVIEKPYSEDEMRDLIRQLVGPAKQL